MSNDKWDEARQDHEREQAWEARQKQRARTWRVLEDEGWCITMWITHPTTCCLWSADARIAAFTSREDAINYALELTRSGK